MYKSFATQCLVDTKDRKKMQGYGVDRIIQLYTKEFDDATSMMDALTPRLGSNIRMIADSGTIHLVANGVIYQIMYSSRTNVLFLLKVFRNPVNTVIANPFSDRVLFKRTTTFSDRVLFKRTTTFSDRGLKEYIIPQSIIYPLYGYDRYRYGNYNLFVSKDGNYCFKSDRVLFKRTTTFSDRDLKECIIPQSTLYPPLCGYDSYHYGNYNLFVSKDGNYCFKKPIIKLMYYWDYHDYHPERYIYAR
jgi:hypothetical protein